MLNSPSTEPIRPGDEIRLIDWKVYAKSDRYFIREYIEQTCLQVIVALDGSGSMRFGLSTATKFEYARAAGTCLARLALRQSDASGLAVIQNGLANYVPPRSNANHFQAVLNTIRTVEPRGDAGLAPALTGTHTPDQTARFDPAILRRL